jgi:5-(carboxyamino)imidazole ribonucleotide mutase
LRPLFEQRLSNVRALRHSWSGFSQGLVNCLPWHLAQWPLALLLFFLFESSPFMNIPLVGIIMGSDSDLPTMQAAIAVCEDFGVPYEVAIVSAHRTPERMVTYAQTAHERGIKVIIAGAGGAAHLPGMVAALTPLPVIGVPVTTRTISGVDSLYSIVQMPGGIPVATVEIGNAKNAGLLAVQILASHQPALLAQVQQYRQSLKEMVMEKQTKLDELGYEQYLQQM